MYRNGYMILLDKPGLWQGINGGFIDNQMEKSGTFFVTQLGPNAGQGTQNEINQIMSSGLYDDINSIYSSLSIYLLQNPNNDLCI